MQKIGMILDTPYPPDIRVNNECQTLIDAGFEVHLFCLSYQKRFVASEVIQRVQVHRYYCTPLLYKLSAWAYTLPLYHWAMKRKIASFIKKVGTTRVHIHDIQIARAVFWLKKKLSLKITLDLHENRPEIMKHYKHVKSLSGRLSIFPSRWKKFEERYARQADNVVVVTEFAKAELVERTHISANKIVVVPNTPGLLFTEHEDFNQKIIDKYQDTFSLLYIGDTSERRGLLTAIEAVGVIGKDIPNLRLAIVGKSSFDDTLKKRVKELRLTNKIIFEGWQEPALLPSYIKACSVGISPLYKNIHHDTTYANKIFQYMALGKPILVSDCLAQEDVVNNSNCGLVFRNKSAGDLAEKVLEMYQNESLFQIFAQNARKAVVEHYNWNTTGKVLADYYLNAST